MRNRFTNFWRELYNDRFKRYLVISLTILGVVLIIISQGSAKPVTIEGFEFHFFYATGCSHCDDQRPFNEELINTYPEVQFIEHDAKESESFALLSKMLEDVGAGDEPLHFPVTIFGNRAFVGWESTETTGKKIEEALQRCLAGDCGEGEGGGVPDNEVTLPIIGEIELSEHSLAGLAVILGVVDGFNPCALWVLVYLISLIMLLKDKKRIWLLVGTFVLASGILYFLFMTAWLNAFLLIGYSRPVTIVVGLVALGGAALNTRELIKTRGAVVCEVVDAESKQKTMGRMERIVSSPLNLATVAGIVALAFVVNSIEFVCSAALPAIFTHVLSLAELPTFRYYAHILLYVGFFMLDDLIIFSAAAFAMTSGGVDRYVKYARPIGIAILIALGIMLLFAPNVLR